MADACKPSTDQEVNMRVEWDRSRGFSIVADNGILVQENVKVECEGTEIAHDAEYADRFREFLGNEMIIED